VTPTHPLRSGLVPAEMLPDVLDGWTGPAFHRGDTDDNRLIPVIVIGEDGFGRPIVSVRPGAPGASYYPTRPERLLMPLARAEVRARVCAVMAVGRRCPCGGFGVQRCIGCGALPDETLRCASQENAGCVFGCDKSCCSGTGYLRPPTPLHAFLPVAEGGRVESAEESAVLLACSVAGVLAGVGPVAALVEHCGGEHWREVIGSVPSGEGIENWYGHRSMSKGSREAMLLARCALREGGGLVVPWVGVERG
jgi:hypothetical protein